MKLSDDQVKNLCKMGQGKKCCRYLVMSSEGFECAKKLEFKSVLDERVKQNTITAQGDNCEGLK